MQGGEKLRHRYQKDAILTFEAKIKDVWNANFGRDIFMIIYINN